MSRMLYVYYTKLLIGKKATEHDEVIEINHYLRNASKKKILWGSFHAYAGV